MNNPVNRSDPPDQNTAYPELNLDAEKYRHYLEDIEVTDEQAEEFLQIIWNMMLKSIDLSLGLDSIQIFLRDCEEKTVQESQQVLRQKETLETFNQSSECKKHPIHTEVQE